MLGLMVVFALTWVILWLVFRGALLYLLIKKIGLLK